MKNRVLVLILALSSTGMTSIGSRASSSSDSINNEAIKNQVFQVLNPQDEDQENKKAESYQEEGQGVSEWASRNNSIRKNTDNKGLSGSTK